MDIEKTTPLKPPAKQQKADAAPKPAPKADPAPRIEPTLKPESGGFKPETAADAWLGLLALRGIAYLFANGGTDFGPGVEAYAKRQKAGWRLPRTVIVPHENMGPARAHGYAMVPGKPQAMMVHVGVG